MLITNPLTINWHLRISISHIFHGNELLLKVFIRVLHQVLHLPLFVQNFLICFQVSINFKHLAFSLNFQQ